MQIWIRISLLLCLFGFLKEVRPSEPFIYDYLIGPWRNVTDNQVIKQVYPVGTYSNLILLVFVFLITDISKYKPLIVVLGISGVVVWSMLIWTTSLLALQILEVFYGMFVASEVAYYTYIYAKVDTEHYQKVTSHTRAAVLAGRALSGTISQVLISTNVMDFKQLNYITLASVSVATIWALFLPPVKNSQYFNTDETKHLPITKKTATAFSLMKTHFVSAYSNASVAKWSLWWALSTCGYVQVESYMQPLYAAIQESNDAAYNGAVEAILTLLGFAAALIAGVLKINWEKTGDLTLGVFSLIQGVFIIVISQTTYIFLCYSLYIIFGILFHFMVTIASAEVAKVIHADSYGLIFGINTFIALVFNSILTAAVATEGIGFALDARDQYIVYGSYHVATALIFLGIGAVYFCKNRMRRQE